MNLLALFTTSFVALLAVGGCDSSEPDRSTLDASSADAASHDASEHLDAGPRLDASMGVRCGELTCSQDEVCVTPACGCRHLDALPDGGCPTRFTLAQDGTCAPNCPFYPPYCWRPDGGALLCSEAIMSHVCHELCI